MTSFSNYICFYFLVNQRKLSFSKPFISCNVITTRCFSWLIYQEWFTFKSVKNSYYKNFPKHSTDLSKWNWLELKIGSTLWNWWPRSGNTKLNFSWHVMCPVNFNWLSGLLSPYPFICESGTALITALFACSVTAVKLIKSLPFPESLKNWFFHLSRI